MIPPASPQPAPVLAVPPGEAGTVPSPLQEIAHALNNDLLIIRLAVPLIRRELDRLGHAHLFVDLRAVEDAVDRAEQHVGRVCALAHGPA